MEIEIKSLGDKSEVGNEKYRGTKDDSMIFCLNTGKHVSHCDGEDWDLGLYLWR